MQSINMGRSRGRGFLNGTEDNSMQSINMGRSRGRGFLNGTENNSVRNFVGANVESSSSPMRCKGIGRIFDTSVFSPTPGATANSVVATCADSETLLNRNFISKPIDINDLPSELLSQILLKINLRSLVNNCSLVCQRWRNAIDFYIWRRANSFCLRFQHETVTDLENCTGLSNLLLFVHCLDNRNVPICFRLTKIFSNAKLESLFDYFSSRFSGRRFQIVHSDFFGKIQNSENFSWINRFQNINALHPNLHFTSPMQMDDWRGIISACAGTLRELRLSIHFCIPPRFLDAYAQKYANFLKRIIADCRNLQHFGLVETTLLCDVNVWNNSLAFPLLKCFFWSFCAEGTVLPNDYFRSVFNFLLNCGNDLQSITLNSCVAGASENETELQSLLYQLGATKPIRSFEFGCRIRNSRTPLSLSRPFRALIDFHQMKNLKIYWHLKETSVLNRLSRQLEGLGLSLNVTVDDLFLSTTFPKGLPNLQHFNFFAENVVASPMSLAKFVLFGCPKLHFFELRSRENGEKFFVDFLIEIYDLYSENRSAFSERIDLDVAVELEKVGDILGSLEFIPHKIVDNGSTPLVYFKFF